ncbi:MAG: HD domain-containing protein [Candidatus Gracilibacteria bacterium]
MLLEEKNFLLAIEHAAPEEKRSLIHALEFAKKAHEGQMRKSGDPYVIHVIDVSRVLWEKFHDLDLAIGGMLHDTVEDVEEVTMEQIYKDFGENVGFIVDAASKDEKSFYLYPKEYFEDKIERQLWAGMKDIRALLVKIADRDHNLSTLKHLQSHKQIRMAFETQAIYKPMRDITNFDSTDSIKEMSTSLHNFLTSKNISTPEAFKNALFETYFDKLEQQLYGLIYNDSSNIIWEIEDYTLYETLINSEDFNINTETISLNLRDNHFSASFYFKKGLLIHQKNTKLKIHTFKQS